MTAAPTLLETPRLRLVPLAGEHAAALATLYADPAVARYVGGARLDAAATAAQVDALAHEWRTEGWGQSALLDRAGGALVGRAGLHRWPVLGDARDEVELGVVLARRCWGRGLAQEATRAWLAWAARHLPAARPPTTSLTWVVDPGNDASRRLAARLGFVHDRDDVTPRGVVVQVHRRRLPDPPGPGGPPAGPPPGPPGEPGPDADAGGRRPPAC